MVLLCAAAIPITRPSKSRLFLQRPSHACNRKLISTTCRATLSGYFPLPDDDADPMSSLELELSEEVVELKNRLQAAKEALQQSEERQRALAPFRVSAPKRGIIGNSRYAVNLRKQILAASRDRRRAPVIIFGEPGLEKLNMAALIHFGSPFSKAPMVSIDCDRLDDDASELIGRGAKRGLLFWIPNEGTLILNNVHKAPPSVLPLLRREVSTASVAASMEDGNGEIVDEEVQVMTAAGTYVTRRLPKCRYPRIIMTAEQRVPALEEYAKVVKVPPLRVRPEDIDDLGTYILRTLARQRGLGPISLTPEALRRLETGQYPNNVSELTAAIQRAVAQTTTAASKAGTRDLNDTTTPIVIGEEVFWGSSQPRDRLRLDLLRAMPLLRPFLRSSTWPNDINFKFTVYAFAALVALLFLGPQDREHNFALNAFWCYWWPLSFIVYPFLGRVWCAVCPFMIYGELVQAMRKATGATLLKWPREAMDQWGAWFLFALFAVILVWEEVWDLPHTAALSSWLLLLITFGAMVGSFFFERRIWCRYLCPIGGMNGLFAKLSMTELRARQGVCSATCSTYGCYKGGPAVPPEGQASNGCPVYSHPAQLTDNRNCVLCMECLKACPHSSIEFRFRMPGADLWDSTRTPMAAESALMFMLLGCVYLHELPLLLTDLGISPSTIVDTKLPHIVASMAVLAVPGLLAWGVDEGWRRLAAVTQPASAAMPSAAAASGDPAAARAISLLQSAATSYTAERAGAPIVAPAKSFVPLSYGYLPLVWAGTLSYYLRLLLTEAGKIVPVAALTFNVDPAPAWLPTLVAPNDVVLFLQGSTLVAGAALSLGMTRRIAAQPWRSVIPHCALIALFTAELWHIIER